MTTQSVWHAGIEKDMGDHHTFSVVLEKWTKPTDTWFHEKEVMKKILLFVVLSIGAAPIWAQTQTKAAARLQAATDVLN